MPLVHGFKLLRNVAIDRAYRSRRVDDLERFLADHADLAGKIIGVVIAFNRPRIIELLVTAVRRHVSDMELLIFDNSRDPDARSAIAGVCADRDLPYLALPANPVRHPNRSHAAALNWVYYNVVQRLRPRVFALIDHDLIPLKPISIAERIGDQPFFGYRVTGRFGWSMWAGYSMFDFSVASRYPLDFGVDFPRNLDTGGRNYPVFFRHFDHRRYRFAPGGQLWLSDAKTGASQRFAVYDEWLHFGGAAYSRIYVERLGLVENLIERLAAGEDYHALTR